MLYHSTKDTHQFNTKIDEVESSSQRSSLHPGHTVDILPYRNATSTLFFEGEASSVQSDAGATALVTRALTSTDYSLHSVNPRDVCYHMKVAYFVKELTHNEKIQFADDFTPKHEFIKSRLPTSFNFIEKTYIRGKYATLGNVTCPQKCIMLTVMVMYPFLIL